MLKLSKQNCCVGNNSFYLSSVCILFIYFLLFLGLGVLGGLVLVRKRNVSLLYNSWRVIGPNTIGSHRGSDSIGDLS
jgi:hypothetical protein